MTTLNRSRGWPVALLAGLSLLSTAVSVRRRAGGAARAGLHRRGVQGRHLRPGPVARGGARLHHRRAFGRGAPGRRTSSGTRPPPASAGSWSPRRSWCPPPGEPALVIDDYAWSADGSRLLVFTNTVKVWRLNTRGDYWVLDRGPRRAAPDRRGLPGLDPHVRQALAGRHAGGLRPGERPLRREPRRRGADPPHLRRLGHQHQRHHRLGLRRGVQAPRRLPLEPGREGHRLLALRRLRDRPVPPGEQHRHHLPGGDLDPLPEGGHHQLRGEDRRGERLRRGAAVDPGAGGGPPRLLPAPHGVGGGGRAPGPADGPPPAGDRPLARRHPDRGDAASAPRRRRRLARHRGRVALAPGRPGAPVDLREGRVAPPLGGAARRWGHASSHPRGLRHPERGGHGPGEGLLHRLPRRRGAALPLRRPPRREGVAGPAHPAGRAGHPRLRHLPRRPVRLPHLLLEGAAPGGVPGDAAVPRDPAGPRGQRRPGREGEADPGPLPPSSSRSTSATASLSTAGW